jgi:hypothetical protein
MKQPLGEVFGHQIDDFSKKAQRYRRNKLCPFNNKVPNCTKDKANDPLGVCSVMHGDERVITCPIRFREDWLIAEDAASFFFSKDANWTSLTEVRLKDYYGKSAGNIDVVLVSYDDDGNITDFGSLEIQAVYISGNIRDPFQHYMSNCKKNQSMDWSGQANYPRPDFLSSSRKRLAPQLMFKGGILQEWGKKMAVAMDLEFYNTLPELEEVSKEEAELAWFVYEIDSVNGISQLQKVKTIYTKFSEALNKITRPRVGKVEDFIATLQTKVSEKIDTPPSNKTIDPPF